MIPTTRGGEDLEACLRSLAAERYPQIDVIVIDNAAPDGSIHVQADASIRVLRNDRNVGFASACNQGIDASSAELILLLNDDTVIEPGALSAVVDTFLGHPAWGACQPKLLLMDDPQKLDSAGSFLTPTGFLVHRGIYGPENQFAASGEIFAAKGAALLLRRAALEATGLFDPRFFAYFEETDLCWRLWLAGWKVGFAADARILHKAGATASALPSSFVQFHSFKNRICTLLKNLGTTRLVWMLPYHLALCLCGSLWLVMRGRPDLGVAIVRAIGWNVTHLGESARERRRIQARRRVSDRELMPRVIRPTPLRELLAYVVRTKSEAGIR